MRMKLSKFLFGNITEEMGNEIKISDGRHWLPMCFKAGKHTKAHFVAVNASTADVECLVECYGKSGVLIAGRDKQFRCYDDPIWRD